MLKKDARKLFRDKRNALTETEKLKADDLLLIQFQTVDLPFLQAAFSYWPIEENNEPNTHLFTEFLRFRNPEIKLAYPVSDFATRTMTAIAVDIDTGFTKRELDIFEPDEGEPLLPEELDLVMIPLLAFDITGNRVGYGMGFYDKYLAGCREDCIKVGFSYFEPLDIISDCTEFDVPLNLCITPQNVYVF